LKDSEIIKKSEEIISKILDLLDVKCKKEISMGIDEMEKKYLKVTIEGEDLGYLIGYRGNTLNSLQLIFAQMLSSEIGEVVTVLIDVNEYRKRREDYLRSLAYRASRQAKESGQDVELPPLPALERRIVHLTLKGEEGIITESEGEGEARHIILKIDKNTKSENNNKSTKEEKS
jgi:spoIIIJ-associated protein